MLAGLPRLVRASAEVRFRGQTALLIGVAVAAFWVASWLLDLPVDPVRTLLAACTTLVLGGLAAGLASTRRLRLGLEETLPPPRRVVYETVADGRERRARLTGIVLLGIMILLVFDRFTDGGGIMAGLVTGLFVGVGTAEALEGRRWHQAERARSARLYLLVKARALMAPYGVVDVYEVPSEDPDRDIDRVGFTRIG